MEVANVANENEQIILDDEEIFDKDLLDDLIAKENIDGFREEFLALHSYEQSEYFEVSDDDIRQKMYRYLSPDEVAEFFESLEIDEEEYKIYLKK